MSANDHPVAGYTFLALALTGVVLAGRAGVEASGRKAFEHAASAITVLAREGKLEEATARLEALRSEASSEERRALADAVQKEISNARIRQAVALGESGELEKAETLLKEIVAQSPDDLDALFNLGIAQLARDRLDDADQTFQQVLAKNPKDYEAVAERAGILARREKVEEALGLLESIPVGQGRLRERLAQDPLWAELPQSDRLAALMKKHGVDEPMDTSITRPPQDTP